MPTKRTRTTRGRNVKTMQNVTIEELMCFQGGWYPNYERRALAWETWSDFLRDWESIRDGYFASENGQRDRANNVMPFAEWVLQTYGANGPSPIDTLPIRYSEYPAVMPQPKVLVRYWEYSAEHDAGPFTVRA